ncbi:MAG: acyl-CoA dehydrogenase family protein [Polyangiaceae bacterium]
MGRALSVLNRLAGSEIIDRFGLREQAQAVAYHAVKNGVVLGDAATKRFKALTKLAKADHLPPAKAREIFDLSFTEEQGMIRDSALRLSKEYLRPAANAASAAAKTPDEAIARINELGLLQYAIPESLGGVGHERAPVTSVLVAEALSYGDMGLAAAGLSSVGVVNALVRWGSADQQSKYLPPFLEDGAPIASLALMEPHVLVDPFSLRTRARQEGSGYVLKGAKTMVPLAERAELMLVSAEIEGRGPGVFLVERGAAGVTTHADPGMGVRGASLGRIVLEDVRLEASALLGEEVSAPAYEEMIDLARIGWCALATGTAQGVLDYVIEYCNDRIAFGEPISNRQAVAFTIANIAIELEGMRLLTLRAASRAEQGLSFHREAYLARVLTAEKAVEIGTNGVQLLGGHGYITEHPVERWYRDLAGAGIMEGGVLA